MSEQPQPLLRLIAPGAAVTITQAGIRAVVLRAEIAAANSDGSLGVDYLVRWFDDGDPCESWMAWHELEIEDEAFRLIVTTENQPKDTDWEE